MTRPCAAMHWLCRTGPQSTGQWLVRVRRTSDYQRRCVRLLLLLQLCLALLLRCRQRHRTSTGVAPVIVRVVISLHVVVLIAYVAVVVSATAAVADARRRETLWLCHACSECITRCPHATLPVAQEVLLGADDASRAHNAQVAEHLIGGEAVMLHDVQADEDACAAEASFAVHRHDPGLSLNNGAKALYNGRRGAAAIREVHLVMAETALCEAPAVIQALIQPDYGRDAGLLERLPIILRREALEARPAGASRVRATECDELAWYRPVEVSVLDALVVLIRLHIERRDAGARQPREIKQLCVTCALEAAQAIQDCQVVRARPAACVSKRRKRLQRQQWAVRIVGGAAEMQDAERANEHSRIGFALRLV